MSIDTNGLSSENILKFYKYIESAGAENHGLLITKGHEKLFEHYIYPYSENTPHTLFSVTKSLVSTAVGFAISEGLFDLDTRVAQYFREYKQSKGTDSITVRHLLTMNSGKKFSFLQDMTGDYVEIFMKAGFREKRGFLYSNNDVHILSALIQKVTGQTVVDYLTPRLFEPMGIEKPEWEKDINGICVGGTGCYLRLKDLVAIVRCYADAGMYEGRQLIPEFWAREATRKQTNIPPETAYSDGYGYLFWINGKDFSMNGLYGQIITYYPDSDMIIGYTNSSVLDKPIMYASETFLRKAPLFPDREADNEKLEEYLKTKDEKCISGAYKYDVPSGVFKITPFSEIVSSLFFPAGLIPRSISSSMAKRPEKGIDNLSFTQNDDCLEIKWTEGGDTVTVNCGLDGTPRLSEASLKGYNYKIWSYGWWDENNLNLTVKPVNTLSTQRMTIKFGKNNVKVTMNDTPHFTDFILHNMSTVEILNKNEKLKKAASAVMKLLLKTAYMPMNFKKIK